MSEFENIVPPNEENPQQDIQEQPAFEEMPPDAEEPAAEEAAPASTADATETEDKSPDSSAIVRKVIKPLCIIAAIIIVVLIFKAIFSSPKDSESTLFVDNMLVFNEINVENQAVMYGVIDKKANIITDADFSLAYLPGENIIVAQEPPAGDELFVQDPASYGLINKKGDEITKFSYSDCGVEFSHGLLPMSEGDKWGFVNTKGEWVIEPAFDKAYSFSEALAGVQDSKSRKWGFVDEKGKWVIKAEFEDVGSFSDSLAPAKKNGKWGFIDEKGEWIVDNDYLDVDTFHDNMARAKDISGDWGYINQKGKWVIKARFQELGLFCESLAVAKKNGKWGFINKKGEWEIDNEFADAGNFSNGLAYAKEDADGKYGYINKKGKWKIEPKYDVAYDFSLELACVKDGDSYGYINKRGKTKIDFAFKYALPFYDDGYAPVCKGKKNTSDEDEWFVINQKGKAIFEDTFDGIMR